MADRNFVGDVEYDGLISGLEPGVQTGGGVIAKLSAVAVYKRGTVLAKSAADGKLYILGTTPADKDVLTPDCILCDDVEVGTEADMNTAVYLAGCFNPDRLAVAEGYTIKESDLDALRQRNIVFKAVLK